MNISRIIIFIGLLLIIVCSCNNIINDECEYISIVEEPIEIKLSEITDSVEYVFLESKTAAISKISEIFYANDKFYIKDLRNKCIYEFSKSGKLLWTLDKFGKGPGEYISFYHINIDEEKHELHLYDNHSGKMLIYNLVNHEFLYDIPFRYHIDDFIKVDDYYLCYCETDITWRQNGDKIPTGLFMVDNQGEFIKHIFHIESEDCKIPGLDQYLYKTSNYISLLSWVSDTIYQISDKQLKPKYYFEFPEKYAPQNIKLINVKSSRSLGDLEYSGYIHVRQPYFENDQHIFFRYYHNKNPYYFIFNKNSNNYIHFNKLINDYGGTSMRLKMSGVTSNAIIFSASVYDELWFREKCSEDYNDYKDNPVLILIYPRV